MSKARVIKVVGNKIGYRQLLNSIEIQHVLNDLGNDIAKRCNGDYVVTTQLGKVRAHTRVATNSQETLNDNYDNNTLIKAVSK